jgi:hypothetical protein
MCKFFVEDSWQSVITSLDVFTNMHVLGACTNLFFYTCNIIMVNTFKGIYLCL